MTKKPANNDGDKNDESKHESNKALANNIVCMCMNVSELDIEQCVEAGARNLSDIQTKTGASTGCGVCKNQIEEMIKKYQKRGPTDKGVNKQL